MRLCIAHSTKLNDALQAQGLLVSMPKDSKEAMEHFSFAATNPGAAIFDPLILVHGEISGAAMSIIYDISLNPLDIYGPTPEKPELGCPICFANYVSLEHDKLCKDPACTKPKGQTYDYLIDEKALKVKTDKEAKG